MARVYWTDRTEESVLEIGRYIIERTQSRQRGLDIISRIEHKCAHYAEFPLSGTSREDTATCERLLNRSSAQAALTIGRKPETATISRK